MQQSEFVAALLDPEKEVPSGVVTPSGEVAGRRFNVYRNNVVVSLGECLIQAYPVVCDLLGEKCFAGIAHEYVRQHPPESPMLILYGKQFPQFLSEFPSLESIPYIRDVAQVERARLEAYHAADAIPIEVQELQQIPEGKMPDITLKFHPSLRLLALATPVFSIMEHLAKETQRSLNISMHPEAGMVVRRQLRVQTVALPAGGLEFIGALQRRQTLTEAANKALQTSPEFDLSANLAILLETSSITDVGI